MTTDNIGEQLYKLCEKMFPICRSITVSQPTEKDLI